MLGILGGTFDPVHLGHVSMALQVKRQLQLNSMQLMPCFQPVHRDASSRSAKQRLDMLDMTLRDFPELTLNTMEIDRGGPSYTVDSLARMQGQSDEPIVFVTGADAFNTFNRWREPDRILQLAHLVVCFRPGVDADAKLYADRQTSSVELLRQQACGKILLLPVEESACSSTEVRQQLARGDVTTDCLPASVLNYISDQNLYRSPSA